MSSSSCLRLLPRPPLTSIFPSVMCFRRQFLRKMWQILSLMSSSSCLRLLPLVPFTSIFPSIMCFRRQFLRKMWQILSLMSSSSCLSLLPRLSFTSIFPSIMCFRRQFLLKVWPIQLAFFFLLYVGYSCPPWHFATLLHFSHDRSNWSFPSFSSTPFLNFPANSGLFSEVSGEYRQILFSWWSSVSSSTGYHHASSNSVLKHLYSNHVEPLKTQIKVPVV